jgi:hypothetical protein
MQKGNEHKIEETLNSLSGIKGAEANAYTFDKVMTRLKEEHGPAIGIRWSWVTAMIMVIVVNTGVAFYGTRSTTKNNTNPNETNYKALGMEMGYTNTYSY